MSAVEIPGLVGPAPTNNEELLAWIADAAELFQPESVVFADGSQEEWDRLASELVEAGHLSASMRKNAPIVSWRAPTPPTWHVWNPARSSAPKLKKAQDPPITGPTRWP